jgi:glycosyltransferase involved in cell wall biosynthesis
MYKKKENPLVSVIIPTYNRGWILKETIDSVLAQDFTNFELIVVDDGSTDNTQGILNSYKKDIVILRQDNKGVSSARNKGIASASGQFIAFLDSDDLWLSQKLSVQVDFFNTNPEALICQTEEKWIRNGIRVNPKKRHKKFSGDIFEPSLYLCLVSPSAVMIKRSLFEKTGMFDETLPACEDYDMWLRISCRYPVYLIDTPLIIKRGGHADQLSRSSGLDRYRIQSLKKIIESNLLTDKQTMAAVKVLKEKCDIYANGCLKRGRKEKALYYNDLAGSCLARVTSPENILCSLP